MAAAGARVVSGTRKIRVKKAKDVMFDYSLLFIIIFLFCFGLVMIYSASSYNANLEFDGDSFHYVKTQLLAGVLGFACMFIISRIDYHFWKKLAWVAYFGSIAAILLVLTPLGIESHGARRWVGVGALQFQPAEIAKIAAIILMAALLERFAKSMRKFSNLVRMIFIIVILAGLIYVITDNLSSAIIILGISVVMMFVVSPKYSHFILSGLAVFAAGAGYLLLAGGFRADRIRVWLNPEAYEQEGGYQVMQGLYAIGSGGVFGKGLGQSVQKLGFVPEAQNDMIFTIICEELGLVGAIAIILVFMIMIWRLLNIANNAQDLFGSLIAAGIMAHIAIQVVLNIAVVTNTIPNTGITLPFISYGGTSIVFLLAEMGLAFSVSRYSAKSGSDRQ